MTVNPNLPALREWIAAEIRRGRDARTLPCIVCGAELERDCGIDCTWSNELAILERLAPARGVNVHAHPVDA